jgi:hypothetical protein
MKLNERICVYVSVYLIVWAEKIRNGEKKEWEKKIERERENKLHYFFFRILYILFVKLK